MAEIDRLEAYRQAGVDLDLSNVASQIAADWAQTTWKNREGQFGEPVSFDSAFSSSKRILFDEIKRRPGVDGVFGMDGAGTKPEFYELMRNFLGLGHDLMAMAVDDIPVEGGQPVLLNNALIVNTLTEENMTYIDQLFQGLAEAANEAGVAIFTGEIAVHGARLQGPTDFTVDLVGDAMGLVHNQRVITGADIKPGDELWAFEEPEGFRCNGISAVRKTFAKAYGEDWHLEPFEGGTLGEAVIAPSTIYAGLMTALTGGYKREVDPMAHIYGAAHITGGGIPEKVGRMLRASGFGAEIIDPFEPPRVMLHAQELTEVEQPDGSSRPMTDEEMLTTWHGGQGYVVAINERDGEGVSLEAQNRGKTAKKIGSVVAKPGIRVISKGTHTPGRWLEF